jgi:HEAT repeat protein
MKPALGLLVASLTVTALAATSVSAQRSSFVDPRLREFHAAEYFGPQLDAAKRLVAAGDPGVIELLEPYLDQEDRHLRGNAAFVLAGLGDTRGLHVLSAILNDRSARGIGQGIPGGNMTVDGQIKADRYYAVHLLGELRNGQAVDVLLPLLADTQVNYKVVWALGQIGDPRAIRPLITALDDSDAIVRVNAILALAELRAAEALPKLQELLNDSELPRAGDRVPVSQTARAAIAKLQASR